MVCGLLILATTGLVLWKKFGSQPATPALATAATTAPAAAAPVPRPAGLVFSLLPPPADPESSAAERASARAAELAGIAPTTPAARGSAEVHDLLVACGKRLRDHIGQQAEVTGLVHDARVSDNNRFRYLDFGSSTDPDAVCVRHPVVKGYKEMYLENLRMLRGNKITVKGTVALDGNGRVVIDVAKRDQITVLDP
jgi:hypothetical protein